MKIILLVISVLAFQFTALAGTTAEGKRCVVDNIGFTKLYVLPPDMNERCANPIRIAADVAHEGEAAEVCSQDPSDHEKDICKVYVSCRNEDQTHRFVIDTKVKYFPILNKVSFGMVPDCQLSEVRAEALEQ